MTYKPAPDMHHQLIDSHCHLDFPAFDQDREHIVDEAVRYGVIALVIPSITAALWDRLKAVAESGHNLFAAYGLHPMFMAEHHTDDLQLLANYLAATPEAVGVGECGLDFFIKNPDREAQRYYFEGQLTLARERSLPIVIHARKAVEDVIDCIRLVGHHSGMVHSFNGSQEQAARLIDLGYSMSFGGAMTYHRAKKLRRLIGTLPLDALLLETDAPDQSDARHQGERNQPAWLLDVFNQVCELRDEPPDEIAVATTANARRLFKLPHQLTNK